MKTASVVNLSGFLFYSLITAFHDTSIRKNTRKNIKELWEIMKTKKDTQQRDIFSIF